MWKWVWIAVIGLLGFAAYQKMKKVGSEAQVAAAAAQRSKGYMEWRATMTIGSRELEIVGVQEAPLLTDCKPGAGTEWLRDACPAEFDCKVKLHECKSTVAGRYTAMLQQKPVAGTHYVHHRMEDPDGVHNMVWLAWGLTEQESKALCFDAASRGSPHPRAKVTCI